MAPTKKNFFYRNSLSIVFSTLFLLALIAQAYFGWKEYNGDREDAGMVDIPLMHYFTTGHFAEATFENFQSEFLQMALYVILTVSLRQVGSAESKAIDKPEEVDREPDPNKPDAPAPVKKGGWRLTLYAHSLSIAFILLFLLTWVLHLYGSYRSFNEELIMKHEPSKPFMEFLPEPTFWFETFQNWQSEFLSVCSIVVLTIFLRQKGSPESKPVDAAHMETGK